MRYNSVCRNKLLLEVLWYVFQYCLLISSSPVSLSVSVRLVLTCFVVGVACFTVCNLSNSFIVKAICFERLFLLLSLSHSVASSPDS